MTTRGSGVRGAARLVVVALVASTVAVTATVGSAAPQTPPADDEVVSFGAAPEVAPGAMSQSGADKLEGAVRSRFVDIPTGSVAPSLDVGRVEVELFPGVGVTLDGDSAPTPGANGSTTWSGLAADGDYATFTFVGGVVYATAAVDGHVYDVSPVSDKTHLVVEEGRVFPDEAEPVGAHGPEAPTAPDGPAAESGGTPRVDVLTWYDTAARDFFGGDTNAQNELAATINETNAAYERSAANLNIASVGIEYEDYTGTGDAGIELNRLATPGGSLADVHARRDAVDADLVSLITDLSNACGVAYLGGPASGSQGFSVVDAGCARGGLSYAHELGHNMGAGHAPGDNDPGGLDFFSYGYLDATNDFRTIMAYDSSSCPGGSCQRVGYFSGPTALYNGHSTGSTLRWNARTLTERAATVAAYRGAPTGPGTGIPAANRISAGGEHTCAISNHGRVRCWGWNLYGQLGYGNTTNIGDDELPGSVGYVFLGPDSTAVQVSASLLHTCAVLDDGTVRCWGYGGGQLGYGNTTSIGDDELPGSAGPVDLGAGRTAVQIDTGGYHTCAVLDDGTVRCWGDGSRAQLGYASLNDVGDNDMPGAWGPVDLGAGRTAVQVTTGGVHTCALLDNGTVRCWGSGYDGQLGYGITDSIGDNETPGSVEPVDLGAGRTAVQVVAGDDHTCAILDNGTGRCWGRNAYGQLGYENTTSIGDDELPGSVGPIDLGAGRTAAQISAGLAHTCAVLDGGALRCWGMNQMGELGLGNTTNVGDDEPPGSMADVALEGVSGTVTEAGTGTPVPGAFVAVLRSTDFAIAGGAVTDTTGNFTVPVGEGSYYLYVVDPTGAHTTGFHGAPATVTVTNNGLTDADPVMPRLRGSITAAVTETGSGAPIGGVWGLALSSSAANPGATELAVIANGSGQLTLPGLAPGNHYVGFVDPTGAHTTRFYPNSPDVPGGTPVAVTAGATTPANASLPAQTPVGTGATISGAVTEQGTNTPLAGARVVALRASDYAMVRGAATNASGQYSLNLAAGDYKLAFFDSTGRHNMEWFDNVPNTGLAAAASVTAPGTADAAMAANTGSMAGTVTDDLTATPIGGVWVLAIGPTGVAGGTLTEVDGTYTIAGLAPGTYRATFVDPGGVRSQQYWNNSADYPGAATFNVTAANTTVGIDAALATPTSE